MQHLHSSAHRHNCYPCNCWLLGVNDSFNRQRGKISILSTLEADLAVKSTLSIYGRLAATKARVDACEEFAFG